ncbi:hypothetical protein SAY86_011806 [Trapa natans]|uniref:Uncharacterized protein n=1 Tax=Trapa natans TaxID=22666 RepID=A0AAN7LW58_TRANT|nr:hypothetical protein SAY86_011806 [Trapa natans]
MIMEARGEQKIMQHMFLHLHQPSLCQNIQPSPETTMTPQNSPGSNISDFAICSALVITYHDWFQQGTRVCSIGLYAMHKITQSCRKDLSHFIFLQVTSIVCWIFDECSSKQIPSHECIHYKHRTKKLTGTGDIRSGASNWQFGR